ncbi:hypothetical protein ACFWXO_37745 [Kitasatospora sp. NPDC059088]|uniref:hypothetical protein n=1 Tax=Kitasatospora sp. NPDC059088 TaxID=3346722 RepID=UPI0036959A53
MPLRREAYGVKRQALHLCDQRERLLDRQTVQTTHRTTPTHGSLPESGRGTEMTACPICGSGNTYQTMEGRWGCTACGSSWG